MMHAIIDIGSNSVRLCIFADGNILLRDKITCQLGEGLFPDMTLKEAAIKRSVEAVRAFYEKALDFGVGLENILPFATAAVRQAKNGKVFLDLVFEKTGLVIDVVSGEKEGDIGLIGALFDKDGAVLDVGGASSELAIRKNGKKVYAKSIDIGAVKLTDMFKEDRGALNEYVSRRVTEYGDIEVENLVVIGGTGTSAAFVYLRDKIYDSERIDGLMMTLDDLRGVADELFSADLSVRAQRFNLEAPRARVILAGITVIIKVLEYLKIDRFTVSEKDNLDGYYFVKTNKVRYEEK